MRELEGKVVIEGNKNLAKEKWEICREERKKGWLVGGCNVGESGGRMNIGGSL